MLTTLHPALEISLVVAIPTLVALWGKYTFMPRRDCELEQQKCSRHLCFKIDEIKAGQEKVAEFMQSTGFALGRIEQFMEDRNNGNRHKPT